MSPLKNKKLKYFIVSVLIVSFSEACDLPFFGGKKLYVDGRPFVVRGAAVMDDSTLWDSAKTTPDSSAIEKRDYAFISMGNINTVRLALKMDYFIDSNDQIKKEGFDFVDKQIEVAKKYGLKIILDMHIPPGGAVEDYRETSENRVFWESEKLQKRFIEGWRAIAERYAGNAVMIGYELMNEPSGSPDKYWMLIEKTVDVIRSADKEHALVIQPSIDWKIRAVKDEKVLYSFHFYDPLMFTHQNLGAGDVFKTEVPIRYPGKIRERTGEVINYDREILRQKIKHISELAKNLNQPVIIGEFGLSTFADEKSMANWIRDVMSLIRENKITGYIYWRHIIDDDVNHRTKNDATMGVINKKNYFSPAQFFGIRPEFSKKKNAFLVEQIYWKESL